MNAIILAAGTGTRMGEYTKDMPKCMLNFAGKTLIQHQVDILRSAGIKDIVVVRGYEGEKIHIDGAGIRYIWNNEYKDTNMVETMMRAENEINEASLICYGDIIYEKRVLEAVLASAVDIGCTVDSDWREYWDFRYEKKEADTESLVIGPGGNITELGAANPPKEKMLMRYVGLIKLSDEGTKIVKHVYHHNTISKRAYMTDFLQTVINNGYSVFPIIIQKGWLEFDTARDYEKLSELYTNGELSNFYNL